MSAADQFRAILNDDTCNGLLWHKDGIAWWKAPTPRRWHRCSVQTGGFDVERCACGAIRFVGNRRWMERNSK